MGQKSGSMSKQSNVVSLIKEKLAKSTKAISIATYVQTRSKFSCKKIKMEQLLLDSREIFRLKLSVVRHLNRLIWIKVGLLMQAILNVQKMTRLNITMISLEHSLS